MKLPSFFLVGSGMELPSLFFVGSIFVGSIFVGYGITISFLCWFSPFSVRPRISPSVFFVGSIFVGFQMELSSLFLVGSRMELPSLFFVGSPFSLLVMEFVDSSNSEESVDEKTGLRKFLRRKNN